MMGLVNKRTVKSFGQTYEVSAKQGERRDEVPEAPGQTVGKLKDWERREMEERNKPQPKKEKNPYKKARGVYGD